MWLSRQRELWDHTAVLHAAVKNLFATNANEMVSPLKLNPYRLEVKKPGKDEVLRIDKSLAAEILKELYGKKKKK